MDPNMDFALRSPTRWKAIIMLLKSMQLGFGRAVTLTVCLCLMGAAAAWAVQQDPAPTKEDDKSQDSAKAAGDTAKQSAGDASKTKASSKTKPEGTDSARDTNPNPRREPSYAEILKELQKETRLTPRPVTPPVRQRLTSRSVPAASGAGKPGLPAARKLLPDGSRLVDRPGRLTREGNRLLFSFEGRGQGEPEMPVQLLPNRLLEDMEIVSAGATRPIVFVVSGEVTEYRGENYLLIQKLLVRPTLGNLR